MYIYLIWIYILLHFNRTWLNQLNQETFKPMPCLIQCLIRLLEPSWIQKRISEIYLFKKIKKSISKSKKNNRTLKEVFLICWKIMILNEILDMFCK